MKPGPPVSAVSSATGLIGLAAMVGAVAWLTGSGLSSGDKTVLVLAVPAAAMIAWVLLVEKAHCKPTTGLDFSTIAPLGPSIRRTVVKLIGLWGCWALIGLGYWVLRTYDHNAYAYYLSLVWALLPNLLWLSVVYVLVIDRYSVDPTADGAWHAGNLFIGRWGGVDREILADYFLGWLIKGFFLAFMMSVAPGAIESMTANPFPAFSDDPVSIASWTIRALFLIDIYFAAIGYIVALRFLDTHIRTANPYLSAWVAALICYSPFVIMGDGGILDYRDGRLWSDWLFGNELVLWVWGGMLVFLTTTYVWATVIFGLRFSNLAHRGIITNGPFRFTKHPAYISKNLFWWLAFMPFLSVTGPEVAVRNCVLLVLVNLVYYWRAKTEEKHLMSDPVYREYVDWIREHGLFARLGFRKRREN